MHEKTIKREFELVGMVVPKFWEENTILVAVRYKSYAPAILLFFFYGLQGGSKLKR